MTDVWAREAAMLPAPLHRGKGNLSFLHHRHHRV